MGDLIEEGFVQTDSGAYEVDVWIPQLNLAVEFHGKQHYQDVPLFGPLELYQQRDALKREACRQSGIRLMEVPYWWDNQANSLHASLYRVAPDACLHPPPELSLPIPDSIPDDTGNRGLSVFAPTHGIDLFVTHRFWLLDG